MANAREISNRMKSIQDTMKITKAMYMISSTKLKKAKKSLDDTEPYFYTLRSEIGRILRHFPDMQHIYFDNRDSDRRENIKRKGFIVVTADKGMAGAYNHNVLKTAEVLMNTPGEHSFFVVGEEGRTYFASKGYPVTEQFHYTAQNPTMHRARSITEKILAAYNNNELDEVDVVYTRMLNSIQEEVETIQLLPLVPGTIVTEKVKEALASMPQEEFIMWPGPQEVIERLVPNYVTGVIYSCLVESYSCEQNARMLAMEAANKSAGAMLKELAIEYNRVRQTAITQEINEVIGGAKALKKKKRR